MAGGDIAAGAVAGAASELANGVLQEALKANPNLSGPDRKAITQWVAVLVGAVAGGETGAATAIDNVNYNFMMHQQKDEIVRKLKECQGDGDPTACKAGVSQEYFDLYYDQEHKLDACKTVKCVTDLLGDLNGNPNFTPEEIMQLQELGLSEELAQPLSAYQVLETPWTDPLSQFEHHILDAIAGASYCEATGGADGCFLKGQLQGFGSDAVGTLAYAILGLATVTPGKGGAAGGQSEASSAEGRIPDVPDGVPYFRVQGGGAGNATSRELLSVNADGSVSIKPGCTGSICVSTGSPDHAVYYLSQKRSDGSVLVFEVDRATHNQIIEASVPQRGNKGAPVQEVDPTTSGSAISLQLNRAYSELMVKGASKGRVLTQEEFFNEFGFH